MILRIKLDVNRALRGLSAIAELLVLVSFIEVSQHTLWTEGILQLVIIWIRTTASNFYRTCKVSHAELSYAYWSHLPETCNYMHSLYFRSLIWTSNEFSNINFPQCKKLLSCSVGFGCFFFVIFAHLFSPPTAVISDQFVYDSSSLFWFLLSPLHSY